MKLSKAANYFKKETFSIYREDTKTWNKSMFSGRLLPVDRFLSNFSRPLHRRMLVCDPKVKIPDSFTVQSEATGEKYIIGKGRYDAYSNSPYQALYMLHNVSGLGAGLGKVTRKVVTGTDTDPGHLVNTLVGEFYMDIELRATTPEKGTEQQTAGQYFLMAPPTSDIVEWDYIALGGINYRVEEGYFDSGLRFARVLQIEDDRVDLTYIKTTGFSYDTGTGVPTDTTAPYSVTGSVHDYKRIVVDTNNVSEDTFKVIIPSINIGFDPKPREVIEIDGAQHDILKVTRNPLKTEWTLICQV